MRGENQNIDLRIVSFPKSLNISSIQDSINVHAKFINDIEHDCIHNPEEVVERLQDQNVRNTIKLPSLNVHITKEDPIKSMKTDN